MDQAIPESLYGDDIGYERFLADTKNELERIKEDSRQDSLKGMRQKLHKIKPSFNVVGLPALTEKLN
ncbi:MAG: hypothetical protein Q8941_12295 [Bacteroidota bacterium]|nr:hypothetical protein [Bacteroidota bacterium]